MTRPDQPVPRQRPHDGLLAALVVVLLLRSALGIWDAWSLFASGVRAVPISEGATVGGTPFWSLLWAALTLSAALLLARRHALGWVLGVASCVAYLASGIGDVALFRMEGAITLGPWVLFLVDLAGPAIVLALLVSIRPWFLTVARRPRFRVATLTDPGRR